VTSAPNSGALAAVLGLTGRMTVVILFIIAKMSFALMK
jgi:hypothetical protein